MFEEVDERMEEVIALAEKHQLPTDIIRKAYQKAKYLHKDQRRKGGAPYITHPVEVAYILAMLRFDENVLAAALLHDTIEDCGYKGKEIRKDFNEEIYYMVDCVSAIDTTDYKVDKDNLYEDASPDMIASSAEEQTFKKLVEMGKLYPCAFAIKFADRLHNLSTISVFDYAKQLEKVKQTEKWVLPIAEKLQSEYFYRAIMNECFKIVNRQNGLQYFNHYNAYHGANAENITALQNKLSEIFLGSYIREWLIVDVKEYKVFEDLKRLYKRINIGSVSQGQIIKVTNYNIFAIYDDAVEHKQAVTQVINILKKKTSLKIIDAKIGGFTGKMYFQVEDVCHNKYNLYIVTEEEYMRMTVGTTNMEHMTQIGADGVDHLDVELMRVKTPTGETIQIAKDSTALDFAFKLHKDLGLSFRYARINGTKTKCPTYAKLSEGDVVEIFTEKDENGAPVCRAKLKWLAHVKTELAKKSLIKYFETLLPDA